ncbi:metal-dependent phosphohydrolase [Erwinia phage vB_EamM_Alexandra]|uniref:HD/PDEase domain-containing protein n=1 Tax=Erwinia phage vB_EamM_Alexandra TaxID=2201424 RepID=A0A2Z4QEK0_9CAUD|nr:metal-dependent phosphohydrolase [Erwinia phage vB_EamM_Alexandra]AWY08344.1 hypothetical protein Alexandra_64 [Erwinia phage vB_EamM_Alexandra]
MLTNIARLVATQAHEGQFRKFNGEPYINHPERVSAWLAQFNVGELIEAGALCHDVLEDCDVSHNTLSLLVDMPVADLVQEVTNRTYPEGTPRIKKFWGNIVKLITASHQAQTLKCGDAYDNCKDVYEKDPVYGAQYIAEKFFLVCLFTRAQADVKQALLDLLNDIYHNRMTDEHRTYAWEYLGRLDAECPIEYRQLYEETSREARSLSRAGLVFGDHNGTATASV